jgi:hypothetical protein
VIFAIFIEADTVNFQSKLFLSVIAFLRPHPLTVSRQRRPVATSFLHHFWKMKRALVIFTLATARNPLRVRGFQVASLLPKTSSARLDCSHVAAYRASPHLSRSSFVSGSFTEQDFLSFPDRRPPHFIFHRVFTRFFHLISQLRKSFAKVALALIIAFSLVSNPALAVTGGRMGGSFGKSSSASMSRPMTRQPSPRSGSRGAPRVAIHNHNSRPRYRYRSTSMYGSFDDALLAPRCHRPVAARFSASDVVLLTGTSALIFYGVTNNFRGKRDGDESALGPGASVASVTVALDVPSRKNPNSVLHRLKRISERANMASRKGVQDLVSEGNWNVFFGGLSSTRSLLFVHFYAPIPGFCPNVNSLLGIVAARKGSFIRQDVLAAFLECHSSRA